MEGRRGEEDHQSNSSFATGGGDGEERRYCNVVPSVTHVLGTVTGTKLLLKPNLYVGKVN